jgi:hypothetical protein
MKNICADTGKIARIWKKTCGYEKKRADMEKSYWLWEKSSGSGK